VALQFRFADARDARKCAQVSRLGAHDRRQGRIVEDHIGRHTLRLRGRIDEEDWIEQAVSLARELAGA
jgi:hypothetical protein